MGAVRGDRSTHPGRTVHRGVWGYRGVAADAASDPARVYPGALVAVNGDGDLETLDNDAVASGSGGGVPTSRQIIAGGGLTGGGTLAADRTIAADFGAASGKVTQGNDSRLSDARAPTAHHVSHEDGGSDEVTLAQTKVKTVHLSAAQILGLFTTPVEALPAPGVGKVIVPVRATWVHHVGSTPYVWAEYIFIAPYDGVWANDDFGIWTGNPPTGDADEIVMLDATADLAHQIGFAAAESSNQPLLIGATIVDPTDGGGGTADVTILYFVANT